MKKTSFISIMFSLVVLLTAFCASAAAREFTFGFRIDYGLAGGTQIKTLLEDTVNVLAEREHINFKTNWYDTDTDFLEAAPGLDFAYTLTENLVGELIDTHGFVPFVTNSAFGKKDYRFCLVVEESRKIEKFEDLKGLKVTTYVNLLNYVLLRQLVSEDPLTFFSDLVSTTSGQVSIDRMLAGESEAAFAAGFTLNAMKITNPGALKTLRTFACTRDPLFSPPLLHSPDAPKDIIRKVLDFMIHMHNDEAMKRFRPMMRMYKLRYFTLTRDDYQPLVDLFNTAEEEGWTKDYSKWVSPEE